MGSHAQDASTQKTASTGATTTDATLDQNAAQNQKFANQTRQSLFGTNVNGTYTGGTVSPYLNPSSMDSNSLNGTYKNAYNTGSNTIAQGADEAVKTSEQNMNSRGMGRTPAGFDADQQRKAYQDGTTARASLYTNEATQQHGDAMTNYWNATNMLNSNATNTANLALQGNSAAAGNYASLYGTASQQVQSPAGAILGAASGLGAAGIGLLKKP